MTHPVFSLTKRRRIAPRHMVLLGGLCALALVNLATPDQAKAQAQSTETFTLPSASPTPTPAPQGPEDERVGVPIGPRVIPEAADTAPAAPPPAAASTTPTPTPTARNRSATSPSAPPLAQPSRAASSTNGQTQQPATSPTRSSPAPSAPSVQNADARGAGIAVDEPVDPGFESLEGDPEALAPRSEDGWYNVDEAGSEGQSRSTAPASGAENATTSPSILTTIWERITAQSEAFLALIALMALLAAILVWVRIQRKRAELAITQAPSTAPTLTAGIRASMGEETATSPRNDVPLGEEFGLDEEDEVADQLAEPETAPDPAPIADPEPEPAPKPEPEPELEPEPEPDSVSESTHQAEPEAGPEPEHKTPLVANASPAPEAPSATPTPALTQPEKKTRLSPFAALKSATPSASVAKPIPTSPLDVDLTLDIKSASRSLMRMSVEFTLEIANRSDQAVRDLNIAGELSSAREGAAGPAPVDKTQHLTKVDRIAPQQSRRVSGTLQLPMSEVTAIRQNGNPVVIPLIHFRLGSANQPAIKRTFVVGTPSAMSNTRVHPLLFDGPPGGLPPLRAQLIKQS
jgi:outer membrane biosynthesis protein TonB